MATQKPKHRIQRGKIEAAIWENESKNGAFYRAKFSRTYKGTDGKLQNSSSFASSELAELALLAIQAQEWMRSAERSTTSDAESAYGDTEAEAAEA